MNTLKKSLLVVCCLLLSAATVWAFDYTKMSNDELSQMRGTMYDAPQKEWDAFHSEWWKRLSAMSPEERQKYVGPRGGMGPGRGMGYGQGMGGYGRGMGYGHHGRGRGCWSCPGWGGNAQQAPAN